MESYLSQFSQWVGKESALKNNLIFFSLEIHAHNNNMGRGFTSKYLLRYFFHLTSFLCCVSGFQFKFSLG